MKLPLPIKIFITIDWFYPAYRAGGPIVSIMNLIDNYNKNIQYFVFCSTVDLGNIELKDIIENQWVKYNENTVVWYTSISYNSIKIFKNIIKQIKPDILYINGIYSIYFNTIPLLSRKKMQIVIAPRGMVHPNALKLKPFKKFLYINFLHLIKITRRAVFHATNEMEKKYILDVFGKNAKIVVAENYPRRIGYSEIIRKNSGNLKMVTIALISPMKNYLNVLYALKDCKGNIEYNIYGPIKEANYWSECIEILKTLPKNVIVQYNGDISPTLVPSILAENHIYIQPSKSENFGHSLYEAFSAGRPVITSKTTPWNHLSERIAGINVNPENIMEITNAIEKFSDMTNDELNIWSSNAFQYSKESVDFEDINKSYEKLFNCR